LTLNYLSSTCLIRSSVVWQPLGAMMPQGIIFPIFYTPIPDLLFGAFSFSNKGDVVHMIAKY
jgi:hypothetical protein